MKQAAVMWNQQLWDMDIPYKMVNFVHDEWEVECYAEHADLIGDIMAESIVQAGKDFNLRCPMAGNKKIGDNWYDVH